MGLLVCFSLCGGVSGESKGLDFSLRASMAPGVWPAAQAQAASTCSLPGLQAEAWKWEPLPILSSQDGSGSPRRVTAVLVRALPRGQSAWILALTARNWARE